MSYLISIKRFSYLHLILLVSILFSLTFSSYSAPIADGKSKFLGNVISFSIPDDFSDYWNQVTPENFGKWGLVEHTRDSMNWVPLQNAYDFAKKNGFPFKQHTFVWGTQEPFWIGSLSKEEQKEEWEEFLRLFAEKFPNTDFADVVNEPINKPISFKDALGGSGVTGWDWVIYAFQKARLYLPNTKLLINEFNIVNSNKNTEKYLEIINILKQRNLIDGIGVQSHCFSLQNINPQTIKNNLDKLASTGLPIYCSELDLQGDDELQKRRYMYYFPIFWEHPAVKGVTLWGYRFKRTWIETTWLKDSSNNERPALSWLKNYVLTGVTGQFPIKMKGIMNYIGKGCLMINSTDPVFLELYTVNGIKISSFMLNGNSHLCLNSIKSSDGVFILRANRRETVRIVFGLDRSMYFIRN